MGAKDFPPRDIQDSRPRDRPKEDDHENPTRNPIRCPFPRLPRRDGLIRARGEADRDGWNPYFPLVVGHRILPASEDGSETVGITVLDETKQINVPGQGIGHHPRRPGAGDGDKSESVKVYVPVWVS